MLTHKTLLQLFFVFFHITGQVSEFLQDRQHLPNATFWPCGADYLLAQMPSIQQLNIYVTTQPTASHANIQLLYGCKKGRHQTHGSVLHAVLEYGVFLSTDISQGRVEMCLRCGAIFNNHFIANLIVNLTLKQFWKSVKIWRSYRREFGVFLVWNTLWRRNSHAVSTAVEQ